jgi:hypothetical protein
MKMRAFWHLRHAALLRNTDVSEVHTASIIMVQGHPDDAGSTHLWNIGLL